MGLSFPAPLGCQLPPLARRYSRRLRRGSWSTSSHKSRRTFPTRGPGARPSWAMNVRPSRASPSGERGKSSAATWLNIARKLSRAPWASGGNAPCRRQGPCQLEEIGQVFRPQTGEEIPGRRQICLFPGKPGQAGNKMVNTPAEPFGIAEGYELGSRIGYPAEEAGQAPVQKGATRLQVFKLTARGWRVSL